MEIVYFGIAHNPDSSFERHFLVFAMLHGKWDETDWKLKALKSLVTQLTRCLYAFCVCCGRMCMCRLNRTNRIMKTQVHASDDLKWITTRKGESFFSWSPCKTKPMLEKAQHFHRFDCFFLSRSVWMVFNAIAFFCMLRSQSPFFMWTHLGIAPFLRICHFNIVCLFCEKLIISRAPTEHKE